MLRLDGEAVIVTGAGGAVGGAIAAALAKAGAAVLVNDVDAARAAATADAIVAGGGEALAVPADIRDESGAALLAARCIERFGRVTGLFNNAGIMRPASLEAATLADLEAMLAVNVVGTFNCARAVVGAMKAQGHGVIVNVTSGAHAGQDGLGGYGASKGAAASFTYAWAGELRAHGIRVNAMSPMADSAMSAQMAAYWRSEGRAFDGTPMPSPAVNAPLAVFLMSKRARDVHGQIVRIDGRRLSLMSHPAIRAPVLERDGWSAEAIADAFDDMLSSRQLPTDVATYDIARVG